MRVLHVITSLDTGGAEMMLSKLLESLSATVPSCVLVLMQRGAIAARIEALGVPVRCIGLDQGKMPRPRDVQLLLRHAKEFSPTVIQGWMYHGNLAAWLLAALLRPHPPLLWNIRQTLYQFANEKRMSRWIIKTGALLSRSPDKIVYNSPLSAEHHERIGYSAAGRVMIHNGFNLSAFKPDAKMKQAVRHELSIPDGVRVIGHVARYHPMKDHLGLLKAVGAVLARVNGVCLVMVGRNVDRENGELTKAIAELGIGDYVRLLGERTDITQLMTAFDFVVLSSAWGEGFPNAVGEAMAAGVPCIVTDVGDSGHIVGDCGRVVPPNDPTALSDAITGMLALSQESYSNLARKARERIASHFDQARIADAYLRLYRNATGVV